MWPKHVGAIISNKIHIVQQVGNKYCVRNTVIRERYNIKNIQITNFNTVLNFW